jgi:hypothetical protein
MKAFNLTQELNYNGEKRKYSFQLENAFEALNEFHVECKDRSSFIMNIGSVKNSKKYSAKVTLTDFEGKVWKKFSVKNY